MTRAQRRAAAERVARHGAIVEVTHYAVSGRVVIAYADGHRLDLGSDGRVIAEGHHA